MRVTKPYSRRVGWRAASHADADSKIHREDIEIAKRRRESFWIGVEKPEPNKHRVIPALGSGQYFIGTKRGVMETTGPALTKALNHWRSEYSYYYREIKDKKCKTGKRWMKTKTPNGVQNMVVTCAPWWSSVIYEQAEAGNTDKVKQFVEIAAGELKATFEQQTNRQVLAVASHFDTHNLHFHLYFTRIGTDHKFIKGTRKKLGLVGPWSVGVLRQGQIEAIPRKGHNFKQADYIKQKTETRLGGDDPLDWKLAKILDLACLSLFGTSAGATKAMALYKMNLQKGTLTSLVQLQGGVNRELAVWQKFLKRNEFGRIELN